MSTHTTRWSTRNYTEGGKRCKQKDYVVYTLHSILCDVTFLLQKQPALLCRRQRAAISDGRLVRFQTISYTWFQFYTLVTIFSRSTDPTRYAYSNPCILFTQTAYLWSAVQAGASIKQLYSEKGICNKIRDKLPFVIETSSSGEESI